MSPLHRMGCGLDMMVLGRCIEPKAMHAKQTPMFAPFVLKFC